MHNKSKKYKSVAVIATILIWLFASCNQQQPKTEAIVGTDTVVLKYAKGFSIAHAGDSTIITVNDPWNPGKVFAGYRICSGCKALSSIDNQELPMSLRNAGVFSSTAIGYLKLLGVDSIVAGITDGNHIYDSVLRRKYEQGILPALGQNMIDNFEAIIDLMPDALVKSGFEQSPSADARYMKMGIPVVYVNDWTENDPLARAEWIKYIACFVGKEKQADSVFDLIESRYLAIKRKTTTVSYSPTVMAGGEYKGVWYVPGGQSYFARFIADAHGNYAWDADTSIGSLSLSLEPVIEKNIDDQYWFATHQLAPSELKEFDQRYALLRSVREGNLYSYSKRTAPNGANDYWESGVCRPDLVLQDIASILHPKLFPGELYYYEKLLGKSATDIRN